MESLAPLTQCVWEGLLYLTNCTVDLCHLGEGRIWSPVQKCGKREKQGGQRGKSMRRQTGEKKGEKNNKYGWPKTEGVVHWLLCIVYTACYTLIRNCQPILKLASCAKQ